ncbi:MAG: hypothetical protein GY851_12300, partial [bacterium]|nr:hypothetical protein [bacterium]
MSVAIALRGLQDTLALRCWSDVQWRQLVRAFGTLDLTGRDRVGTPQLLLSVLSRASLLLGALVDSWIPVRMHHTEARTIRCRRCGTFTTTERCKGERSNNVVRLKTDPAGAVNLQDLMKPPLMQHACPYCKLTAFARILPWIHPETMQIVFSMPTPQDGERSNPDFVVPPTLRSQPDDAEFELRAVAQYSGWHRAAVWAGGRWQLADNEVVVDLGLGSGSWIPLMYPADFAVTTLFYARLGVPSPGSPLTGLENVGGMS